MRRLLGTMALAGSSAARWRLTSSRERVGYVMKLSVLGSLCLCAVLIATPAVAKLMLFGSTGHDDYLGCLDCSEYASDSICNEYGTYGGQYSIDSIFNQYGIYGSKYNQKSPWNEYTSSNDVPVLVDENGGFYGYFTINKYRSDAVGFASDLNTVYDNANGDLELVRDAICAAF